jgi:hypothetical protein
VRDLWGRPDRTGRAARAFGQARAVLLKRVPAAGLPAADGRRQRVRATAGGGVTSDHGATGSYVTGDSGDHGAAGHRAVDGAVPPARPA